MKLFCYLTDKDLFHEHFRRTLAIRLLDSRCNIEIEQSVISFLKAECGPDWTARLEGMFQDVILGQDVSRAYKDAIRKNQLPPIPNSVDLYVHVRWPAAGRQALLSATWGSLCLIDRFSTTLIGRLPAPRPRSFGCSTSSTH